MSGTFLIPSTCRLRTNAASVFKPKPVACWPADGLASDTRALGLMNETHTVSGDEKVSRASYFDGHQNWASRMSRLGPSTALILFVIAILLSAWNPTAASSDRGNISGQSRVMLSLEQLISTVRDIEIGSRG